MRTFAVWQSRPVFVTSTFRDMQAERDWLHAHVFPVLAERLRERFHHLEPVDLRWGVETVSNGEARELLVLKVCLAEIKRCRPFLIALIGDRYGWRPPEERMSTAAREAGFAGDLRGKSVTALEIEYGILDSPEQRKLSRFYLRDPLPYDAMDRATAADYSDLHSGEPHAQEAHKRLISLKNRIRREMPDRVRDYRLVWDAATGRVTGLEAWGNQVLEDVWSDLEAATREYEHAKPATAQQEEAYVLEQFLEEKSRDFAGREDLQAELAAFAQSPVSPGALWGLAITGESGAGKSALFAKLARTLEKCDVLLLTHAAGIGPRSGRIETLLVGWIGELARYLGEAESWEEVADRPELEERFAELLSRAARRVRVVLLVDALNQFERTPAARHLTWLPQVWPPNARLIATTIPGSESDALAKRSGCIMKPLPALNAAEAGRIIDTVCARYRKVLHSEVRAALLARRLPDGSPSCGVPLWVELAMEELLLLDADDFARSRQFEGDAEQQLHALLVSVARELPASAEGLCDYLLERTEQIHGQVFARAIAELITLSRAGWRDSDLQALIPVFTSEQWDPLRFAALRRSFRAQLVPRGASGQWDFSHAQMRAAVENKLAPGTRQRKHAQIAAHLARLPDGDPLRQSERMFHLIGADDRAGAAICYAESALSSDTGLLAARAAESELGAQWVASLPALFYRNSASSTVEAPTLMRNLTLIEREIGVPVVVTPDSIKQNLLHLLCSRYLLELDPALANVTGIVARITVTEAAQRAAQELAEQEPREPLYSRDLSLASETLRGLYAELGDPQRAQEFHEKHLHSESQGRDEDHSDLNLGDLHRERGDLRRALAFYKKALSSICDPRRLVVGIAGDSRGYTADYFKQLQQCYSRMSEVHQALGDPQRALRFCQKALTAIEERQRLPSSGVAYPADEIEDEYERAATLRGIGDLHDELGSPRQALEYFEKSLAVHERLQRQNPDDTANARGLAVTLGRLGDTQRAMAEPQLALAFYQRSLSLRLDLRRRNPASAEFARDLAVSCHWLFTTYREIHDEPHARLFRDHFKSIIDDMRRRSMFVPADLDDEYRRLFAHATIAPPPPPAGDTLREVGTALESGDWKKCEELLSRPAKADKRLKNALAVVRLRQGRIPEAIEILRALLYPQNGIVMDTTVPEVYIVNFAVALALSGNEAGLENALHQLKTSPHPTVKVLRSALADRRAARSWWKRLAGTAGTAPFRLDIPLGELFLGG